jgi:anti-anti-sigma factor
LAPNFHIESEVQPEATVVTVTGELDIASAPQLESTLAELNSPQRMVVIDLRQLEFVDSTGLGVLVRAHQHAAERGTRIGLVRGAGQVEKLLSLTGLESQLLIGDTVEELVDGTA